MHKLSVMLGEKSERLKQVEKHRDTNDENEKLDEILLRVKDIQILIKERESPSQTTVPG